tara:strand:- start:317 stop:487 length:171 start_codon:yes stop_codon:yes gene_type:complete
MLTYLVIFITLIVLFTVILIVAKPIIKGFKARQKVEKVKDFDNSKNKIETSTTDKN